MFLEITAIPRFDGSGQLKGLVHIVRDITERKKAEESLKETNAFLNTLMNAIPVPIFYKDTDGRYTGVNKSFEEFFGKTIQELVGKSVFDISPRDLAEIYHAKDLELFHNPGVQVYGSQVKDASGAVHDVIFHKSTFSDPQGHVIGMIGVILDITKLKKAQEQLRLSEEKYLNLFQDAPLMYVVTRNEQGVPFIIDCNKLFHNSIGFAREEVMGKPMADFYSPESQTQLLEGGGFARALAGDFVMGERQLVARDGTVINTLLYTRPETDASGLVIPILFLNCNLQVFKVGHRAKSFWVVL
jgi:PAS domain S-box-containing protein